ncbi:MAG TPA: hypothetical protein VMZ04_01545 [Anaerolineae bacterium]|nr:hypothetical protein [Anaerolineae bacterium]
MEQLNLDWIMANPLNKELAQNDYLVLTAVIARCGKRVQSNKVGILSSISSDN